MKEEELSWNRFSEVVKPNVANQVPVFLVSHIFVAVLRIRIQDLETGIRATVLFWPLDPESGSGINIPDDRYFRQPRNIFGG
jgi:hypothetical protein